MTDIGPDWRRALRDLPRHLAPAGIDSAEHQEERLEVDDGGGHEHQEIAELSILREPQARLLR